MSKTEMKILSKKKKYENYPILASSPLYIKILLTFYFICDNILNVKLYFSIIFIFLNTHLKWRFLHISYFPYLLVSHLPY